MFLSIMRSNLLFRQFKAQKIDMYMFWLTIITEVFINSERTPRRLEKFRYFKDASIGIRDMQLKLALPISLSDC